MQPIRSQSGGQTVTAKFRQGQAALASAAENPSGYQAPPAGKKVCCLKKMGVTRSF